MTVRLAMWSGPRNISTALMRSFESRPDCAVVDEPFYAAYLAETGLDHPLREAVLASQPILWTEVVDALNRPPAGGEPLVYEKQMTHHMMWDVGEAFMAGRRNAFLIRDPAAVLASYDRSRGEASLADIGVERQLELFDREADRRGAPPPVIDGADVLADPAGVLTALCARLGVSFRTEMLAWRAGRRASDGVWAPAWYAAVEASTGFAPPSQTPPAALPPHLERIAAQARPAYETLHRHRIRPPAAAAPQSTA